MSANPYIESVLSVSELNEQIKSLLETTFARVRVEGEISNLTYHNSGHIYFSIKDDKSNIRCVMFRGNASRLKFRLEQGQSIVVDGAISLYVPRGDYQVNCFSIEPSGVGALALAFKQLQEKLREKGWFDHSLKKTIPKFPKHIVLVTSATGAALQDMKRVAEKRWKLLKITVIDTLVQGEGSVHNIVRHIGYADSLGADVMIVGRGGGSIEDLWAFNEEKVAQAIFEAKTPVVSAVGHEVDVMISDFVADLRAPTPSAAMEMILPDENEMLMYLDSLMEEMVRHQNRILHTKQEILKHLNEAYQRHSIENKIAAFEQDIKRIKTQLDQQLAYSFRRLETTLPELYLQLNRAMQQKFSEKENLLKTIISTYETNNPAKKSKKGYAQVIKEGKVVSLSEIAVNEAFSLQDFEYKIDVTATKKSPI